jgi:hypothetical protein
VEIVSSDNELVDCCMVLAHRIQQIKIMPPSWKPKNLPMELSCPFHNNKRTRDNKQAHNDHTECKGRDRTVDCCVGVQQRWRTATT